MKASLKLLAFVAFATAQDLDPIVDESLIDRPEEGIDFPGCYSDLARADFNGDGVIKQNEYLSFINEYGKRICFSTDQLTLQQSATFNYLACICSSVEGATDDCCIGSNAQILTAGATSTSASRTPNQEGYLTTVCKLTDATIAGSCRPVVRDRGEPLGALVAEPPSDGISDALLWGLIAAALLLFLCCCCCCCVWRRKKKQEEEEEEEEIRRQEAIAAKQFPAPEQAPEAPPGPHLLRKTGIDPVDGPSNMNEEIEPQNPFGPGIGASGAAVAEDSDEDEDGRKRRGGGNLDDPDEELGMRIPTAPRLPPPDIPEDPNRNLRPIPPKEEEDDEWDHPGRNIEFPKDKDEDSAQELDHYVPDGGVFLPEREGKEPLNWNKDWNRAKPEDPDEVDLRKHRIQSGLGEGEVWDKLEESETEKAAAPKGDVFDWVVSSALGALDTEQREQV